MWLPSRKITSFWFIATVTGRTEAGEGWMAWKDKRKPRNGRDLNSWLPVWCVTITPLNPGHSAYLSMPSSVSLQNWNLTHCHNFWKRSKEENADSSNAPFEKVKDGIMNSVWTMPNINSRYSSDHPIYSVEIASSSKKVIQIEVHQIRVFQWSSRERL